MITISTDRDLLDVALIHRFLSEESYWAKNIPLAVVEKAVVNSLCFGAYDDSAQVGFARVVSDRATFAYIGDVFVLASHRGRGISKMVMAAICSYPELQGLRRWHLLTRDAHALYAQYGFAALENPARHMEAFTPDVYGAR
jgi:GNAT superfamily N-acetyltransferase